MSIEQMSEWRVAKPCHEGWLPSVFLAVLELWEPVSSLVRMVASLLVPCFTELLWALPGMTLSLRWKKVKRKKKRQFHSSHCGSSITKHTSIHEDLSSIPSLTQWVKDSVLSMSHGVSCRCSSDPKLLWLWCRPVATARFQPIARELSYATGAALKWQKKKKRQFWSWKISVTTYSGSL